MITRSFEDYRVYFSKRDEGDAKDNPAFLDFFTPGEQKHGKEIIVVDTKFQLDINFKGDGIISSLENQKMGVRVADCNGIVIMGNNYYSVLHAGWQGLSSDIIGYSMDILGKKGENTEFLKIFVGPSIRSCCYEVGEEFKEKFNKKYLLERENKLYLDMILFITDKFKSLGVLENNIYIEPICTLCQKDEFSSYRGGDRSLRMLIGVEKIEETKNLN